MKPDDMPVSFEDLMSPARGCFLGIALGAILTVLLTCPLWIPALVKLIYK